LGHFFRLGERKFLTTRQFGECFEKVIHTPVTTVMRIIFLLSLSYQLKKKVAAYKMDIMVVCLAGITLNVPKPVLR
jgi:hypothetical protein